MARTEKKSNEREVEEAAIASSMVESGSFERIDQSQRVTAGPNPSSDLDQQVIKSLTLKSRCRMLVGSRQDQTLVLLILPELGGSRFVAVDDKRVISQGRLPFVPRRSHFGQSEYGSSVFAFSMPHPDLNNRYRVDIFRGGHRVFSSESVIDYGIAKDASSYFTVDPLAEDSALLRVRNFKQGSERHFNLGQVYKADSEGQLSYRANYTVDETEIHLIPRGQELRKVNRFFPVGDGRPRRVVVELHSPSSETLFESGDVLYILSLTDDKRDGVIARYSNKEGGRWALSQDWTKTLDPFLYTGGLSLAEEGRRLIVHAEPAPIVLNTSTGDSLIAVPIWGEEWNELFGEASLVRVLRAFQKEVRFPRSGVVHRDELGKGNTLLAVYKSMEASAPDSFPLVKIDSFLDLDSLGETNQETESTAQGYLARCRIADPPFAGVAPEVAELPLMEY